MIILIKNFQEKGYQLVHLILAARLDLEDAIEALMVGESFSLKDSSIKLCSNQRVVYWTRRSRNEERVIKI